MPTAAAATAGGAATTPGSTHPATASTRVLSERRARMAPVLIGLALIVIAAIAGLLIGKGSGGSDESTPTADNVNTAGALELSYPDGWQRTDSPPEIPGLRLQSPIALAQDGGAGDALQAGTTRATGPSLLPGTFLRTLGEEPPRDDAVRLGELDAYRYRNLRPEGFDGPLTLYVAPTTAGVATVACSATAASAETFLPEVRGRGRWAEARPGRGLRARARTRTTWPSSTARWSG